MKREKEREGEEEEQQQTATTDSIKRVIVKKLLEHNNLSPLVVKWNTQKQNDSV